MNRCVRARDVALRARRVQCRAPLERPEFQPGDQRFTVEKFVDRTHRRVCQCVAQCAEAAGCADEHRVHAGFDEGIARRRGELGTDDIPWMQRQCAATALSAAILLRNRARRAGAVRRRARRDPPRMQRNRGTGPRAPATARVAAMVATESAAIVAVRVRADSGPFLPGNAAHREDVRAAVPPAACAAGPAATLARGSGSGVRPTRATTPESPRSTRRNAPATGKPVRNSCTPGIGPDASSATALPRSAQPPAPAQTQCVRAAIRPLCVPRDRWDSAAGTGHI